MMINGHLIKSLSLLYNKGMEERETHNDVVQVTRTFTVSVVNLAIDDYDIFIRGCEWFLNETGGIEEVFGTEPRERVAYDMALRSAGATAAECAAAGTYGGTLWLMWEGEYTYWNDIDPNELYPDPTSIRNGDVIIFGKCEFFVGGEDESTEIVGLHD
jgi:hypothetical protein